MAEAPSHTIGAPEATLGQPSLKEVFWARIEAPKF